MREKRARLQAQVFKKSETVSLDNNQLQIIIKQNAQLTEKITDYTDNINGLPAKRKDIPSSIKVRDLPLDKQYNKLIEESKKKHYFNALLQS